MGNAKLVFQCHRHSDSKLLPFSLPVMQTGVGTMYCRLSSTIIIASNRFVQFQVLLFHLTQMCRRSFCQVTYLAVASVERSSIIDLSLLMHKQNFVFNDLSKDMNKVGPYGVQPLCFLSHRGGFEAGRKSASPSQFT